MAIKEVPTNIRIYYKLMNRASEKRVKDTEAKIREVRIRKDSLYREIRNNKALYLDKFNIDLSKYEEFVSNKYISGSFLRMSRGAYINKTNDYEITGALYTLLVYAKVQKELVDLEHDLTLYSKMNNLSISEYTKILRTFYTQVHKEMIINGCGYAFSHNIGWICINRCIIVGNRKTIDYAATKKREAELKAEGKRIYNKEEADWCLRNGIEYKAEDKRVFRTNEYCYEIPLLDCKLPNGRKFKLEISDYRHTSVRGKTNNQLIEECNYDINKICELPVDLKTKLTLCDTADKVLYTNFIRNEDQTPIAYTKIDRKDRQ